MSVVEVTRSGPVTTVTLADEARRNVLSAELVSGLLDALDEAADDPSTRVVVVTNRGSTFCAGADLTTAAGPGAPGLVALLQRIRQCPKPVVGRLAGHCVAGGVGLAAAMDVSVALDTARFGFTEARVGVAPAMIAVVCLPKMRLGEAREAFLRANRFSATDAVRLGLINHAVASEDLDATVDAIVDDLLAGAPEALAAAKQLTDVVPNLPPDEAFTWAAELSAHLFAGEAAREGMAAFLEKRPATWVVRRGAV